MASRGTGKAPARPVTVEDDDDNLDDLDDVLEEFSKPPPTKASASDKPIYGPPRPPSTSAQPNVPELGDDLASELAAGMEELMRELGGAGGGENLPSAEQEKQMREAWEKLLIGDLEGVPADDSILPNLPEYKGAASSSKTNGTAAASEDAFQKSIKDMMDRLKNTDDSLKAKAASSSDPLSELLSQLGDIGSGDGEEGEEGDVKAVLETIMSQLMSKEMLYEPLKELDDKYPEYFKEKGSTIPSTDLEKYKKQQTIIAKVVKIFEDTAYSDEGPQNAQVLTLMNEMQTLGSPPAEIMGDLPPGWALGADGMPSTGDGCTIA